MDVARPVDPQHALDLLVIGAGPTGLAIGAAAVKAGLEVALLDRGGLCDGIRQYPTDLQFFTTRERLEIAGVPFAIPDAKPSRRQALAYYREVSQTTLDRLNSRLERLRGCVATACRSAENEVIK